MPQDATNWQASHDRIAEKHRWDCGSAPACAIRPTEPSAESIDDDNDRLYSADGTPQPRLAMPLVGRLSEPPMCPPRTRILNYASGDSKALYPAMNRQVFNTEIRGKRWNWCEITDADLPATGLKPFKSQMLRDAMWFCGVVQQTSATDMYK